MRSRLPAAARLLAGPPLMPPPQLLLLLAGAVAVGSDWTLSTKHLALTFGGQTGVVSAVVDKATGRNLVLAPNSSGSAATLPQYSLISAVFANATEKAASSPTSVAYDASSQLITANFANGAVVPVSVNITEDDMIVLTIEAAGAHVTGLTNVLFLTTPVQLPSCAAGPTAVFDDTFALLLLPGSLQTGVDALQQRAGHWSNGYTTCNVSATGVILQAHTPLWGGPQGHLTGHSAALWGGQRSDLDAAIQRGEAAFGLPSPKIGGVWAKRSPDAKLGYFLITVTPDTLDATIKYALDSGMGYITFLDNIWGSTSGGGSTMGGHYNFSSLWGGLAGMKQAVQKVTAAGLKAGMHTLSGNIAKTDPYVTPVPDQRLAKTAVNSLSAAVDTAATSLPLAQPTGKLPSPSGPHLYPAATDVLIGSEIISYGAVNASGVSDVRRGAYNTTASPHPAGTTLYLLTQVYGGFLPDPSTDMIQEIAGNIAYAYTEAGFSMGE